MDSSGMPVNETRDEQAAVALGVTVAEWRAAIETLSAAFGPDAGSEASDDGFHLIDTALTKGRIGRVSGLIRRFATHAVSYDVTCTYNQDLGWGWELTGVTLDDATEVGAETFDQLHEATFSLLSALPWVAFDAGDDDNDEDRTIDIATGSWSRTR